MSYTARAQLLPSSHSTSLGQTVTDTSKQGTISCHVDLSVAIQKIGAKKFIMLLAIFCV